LHPSKLTYLFEELNKLNENTVNIISIQLLVVKLIFCLIRNYSDIEDSFNLHRMIWFSHLSIQLNNKCFSANFLNLVRQFACNKHPLDIMFPEEFEIKEELNVFKKYESNENNPSLNYVGYLLLFRMISNGFSVLIETIDSLLKISVKGIPMEYAQEVKKEQRIVDSTQAEISKISNFQGFSTYTEQTLDEINQINLPRISNIESVDFEHEETKKDSSTRETKKTIEDYEIFKLIFISGNFSLKLFLSGLFNIPENILKDFQIESNLENLSTKRIMEICYLLTGQHFSDFPNSKILYQIGLEFLSEAMFIAETSTNFQAIINRALRGINKIHFKFR